jgi:hypothetical protein
VSSIKKLILIKSKEGTLSKINKELNSKWNQENHSSFDKKRVEGNGKEVRIISIKIEVI